MSIEKVFHQKLDECIAEGRAPVVFIKKAIVLCGGSFNGIQLARLAIDQGAVKKSSKRSQITRKRYCYFCCDS